MRLSLGAAPWVPAPPLYPPPPPGPPAPEINLRHSRSAKGDNRDRPTPIGRCRGMQGSEPRTADLDQPEGREGVLPSQALRSVASWYPAWHPQWARPRSARHVCMQPPFRSTHGFLPTVAARRHGGKSKRWGALAVRGTFSGASREAPTWSSHPSCSGLTGWAVDSG